MLVRLAVVRTYRFFWGSEVTELKIYCQFICGDEGSLGLLGRIKGHIFIGMMDNALCFDSDVLKQRGNKVTASDGTRDPDMG